MNPDTTQAIEALAATPKRLAQLVAEATDARLDASEDGNWSARTILAHVRDDEYLCMRLALERMLAEDGPDLRFIDGGDWEPGRNRERERKEWLLGDFALQRQASLGILRGMRTADWERTGSNGARTFSIAQFTQAWAGHDAEHLAQLEALLGETVAEAIARRSRPA